MNLAKRLRLLRNDKFECGDCKSNFDYWDESYGGCNI